MLYRKSTYAVLFLTFLLLTVTASATTYYLSSSSGNDSNSGTDPSSAWRSINKLNSVSLQAGDNVLFQRGDTFYGNVTISNSGSGGNPITFGAYGSGPKPIVTGFTKVTSWNSLGGNIWESSNPVSTLSNLKLVVVNGVNTPMGRYPNASTSYPFLPNYFYFQSHNGTGLGNTSLTSSSLSSGTNWTGADIVVRVNHWTLDKERITSQSGSTINYSGQSSAGIVDSWGFFIQNDPRTLDIQNEWYYNPSTHKIRIYSTSTPSDVLVTTVDTIFYAYNKTDLTIDNLNVQGANTTAVDLRNCDHAVITNCNISYTGDVAVDLNNQNYIYSSDVENNYITNAGSSSIFTSGGANMIIKNNTVRGSGVISVIKPDDYSNAAILIQSSANSLLQYNKIDSSAYSGIQFRGNGIQVRNNLVNHSSLVRDDGGGIYTGYPNEKGKVIDGNIVLNSVGNMNGVPVKGAALMSSGIYIDDLGNDVRITNNTIANCSSAGLFLHTTSNITAYNNTCYNNGGWLLPAAVFLFKPT